MQPHNANFDAFEVVGVASNQGGGFLQVEQGAPRTMGRICIRFWRCGCAVACKMPKGRAGEGVVVYWFGCFEPQTISETIHEQSSAVCGGVEHEGVIG